MREGSLYTLTGRTGEGKTAWLIMLALAVATGRGELIGRKVKKGRVAFATAENPDDLRMRFMVACFVLNIDIESVGRDLIISDNRVAPEDIIDWIKESGETFGLVIIDTWQAFFDGHDANKPTEAVDFTRRFRPMTAVRGHPVVVIAAHPPKQAKDDNLLPYGGGSTLNEVDGNFSLRRDENGLYRFHWQGKIRGLPFDPVYFKIDRLDCPDVITIEGVRVPMPVMFPIDEAAVEARGAAIANRDLALLKAMHDDPNGSERKWAITIGARNRDIVARRLNSLLHDKLVTKKVRRWKLTPEGKNLAVSVGQTSETNRAEQSSKRPEMGQSQNAPVKDIS
jgi:hypothetical protein